MKTTISQYTWVHDCKSIKPFAIPSEPKFELEIPRAATILDVSAKQGVPYLWILHDTDGVLIWRTFILVPAFKTIPNTLDTQYVGSFNTKANRIFVFEEI